MGTSKYDIKTVLTEHMPDMSVSSNGGGRVYEIIFTEEDVKDNKLCLTKKIAKLFPFQDMLINVGDVFNTFIQDSVFPESHSNFYSFLVTEVRYGNNSVIHLGQLQLTRVFDGDNTTQWTLTENFFFN